MSVAGRGRAAWLLASLWTSGCGPAQMPPSSGHGLIGDSAPPIDGAGGVGGVHVPALSAPVTVVAFWASWCETCAVTLPELNRVYEGNDTGEPYVVGVSMDDDAGTARATRDRWGLDFPVVHDAGGRLASRYGVTQVPRFFVLDRRHRVRWVGHSERNAELAVDYLRR